MKSITANEAMLSAFQGVERVVEVRDASGTLLGFYAPVVPGYARNLALVVAQFQAGKDEFDLQAELPADFDMVDWERRVALEAGLGVPLSGVYEHLKNITVDPAMRQYLQEQIDRLKEEDRCDRAQFVSPP